MAITWRQHIKNTMARMEKGTHLKEVLKEASKTWKSVKKDTSAVVGEVVGKTRAHRKRGRKGTKARKGTRKHKKSHRRGRRGGAVMAVEGGMFSKQGCAGGGGVAKGASPIGKGM
jgi:hypothetical protein